MKKFILITMTSVLTLSSVSYAHFAANELSWLKPGFIAVVLPATDSGESFTMKMEPEGFTICASIANPASAVIPGPTHCNFRITPPGFHLPAEILLRRNRMFTTLKEVLKGSLAALPLVAESMSLGVTSEVGQAAANIIAPTPMEEIRADHQLSKTFANLEHYSAMASAEGKGTLPVAIIPYHFSDVLAAFQDRVNKYIKKCANAPDIKGTFCYDQKYAVAMAINYAAKQNVPMVGAQAGEPGQPELWSPSDLPSPLPGPKP